MFRYCGEYFDKETGTVYLRARYYCPTIGRFISEDSVWGKDNDPLSLNLYTYCSNDPVMMVDPSGHIVETVIDLASIGWSAHDLWNNPSWGNFGYFAWDIGATFVPFVPGSWSARGVKAGTKLLSHADDYTKTGVWAMKSFDRGYDIERALGGWCDNFPVIDKAVDGARGYADSITSIKSMDVTAKSYNKGNNMYNTLKGYVNDLAGFTDKTWGGRTVNVGDDTKRILELALPAVELSKKQADQLSKVMNYAQDKGIEIVVKIVQ